MTSYLLILSVLGEDYTLPSSQEVTFSSGDMEGDTDCATYGIIDDDNLEFDHVFTVSVSSFTPTGPSVSATIPSTAVTINDDEGMHCTMVTFLHTLLLAGLLFKFRWKFLFILSSSMTAVINNILSYSIKSACKVLLSTDTQLASCGNPFKYMQFKEYVRSTERYGAGTEQEGSYVFVIAVVILCLEVFFAGCKAADKLHDVWETLIVNFLSFGRALIATLYFHCIINAFSFLAILLCRLYEHEPRNTKDSNA